ncbi:MAG: CvpA family protein [Alphaproteobacteria bacterium]
MEFLSHLNWIDIFILVILVLSAIAGMVRGFFKEICTLGVWLFSALGAWMFAQSLATKLVDWMGEKTYSRMQEVFDNQGYLDFALRLAAGIIIFIILLIFLQIIVSVFTAKIRLKALTSVDKMLGLVVGVVRGLLVLGVLWYFVHNVMGITTVTETNKDRAYIQQSQKSILLPPVKITANIVKPFLDPFVNRVTSSNGQMAEPQTLPVNESQTQGSEDTQTQSLEVIEDISVIEAPNAQPTTTNDIGNAQDATERAITPTVGNSDAATNPGLSDEALQEIQDLLSN